MMAWANSEPTQHLALYSDKMLKLEKGHIRVSWQRLVCLQKWDFSANVFAGTDYGISTLSSYIYSGADNCKDRSNYDTSNTIWHRYSIPRRLSKYDLGNKWYIWACQQFSWWYKYYISIQISSIWPPISKMATMVHPKILSFNFRITAGSQIRWFAETDMCT